MTNEDLITQAASALNSQNLGDFYVADVGCALISENDELFTGACVGGELGICAEQSAVSSMVSKGRPRSLISGDLPQAGRRGRRRSGHWSGRV